MNKKLKCSVFIMLAFLVVFSVAFLEIYDYELKSEAQHKAHNPMYSYHKVKKWIGIGVRFVSIEEKKESYLEIIDVLPNSPAKQSGLKVGDLIELVNDKRVFTKNELNRIISNTPVGQDISLKIFRDGQNNNFSITISVIPNQIK